MSEKIENINLDGMEKPIQLTTGIKKYPFYDELGNYLCCLEYNPSDTNIMKRLNEAEAALAQVDDEYSNLPENPDERAKKTGELEDILAEKTDYVFNAKVSEQLFKHVGPFSPVNGRFFIEQIWEAVGKIIEENASEELKKFKKRVKKHTSKYHN